MAKTTISNTDALRKKMWESVLWRDTLVNSYFMSKFASADTNNFVIGQGWKGQIYEGAPNGIVHVKQDLGKKGKTKSSNGDKLIFGLIPRLDPKVHVGVTSGQTLEGKEVSLKWYSDEIELLRFRNAVSAGSHMDWQKASFDMPTEARNALLTWGAEKIDLLCFEALETNPTEIFYRTGNNVIRTNSFATARSQLHATDSKITPAFLDYLKVWARTGGGRADGKIPLRPIMVDGKPYLVFLTHPDVEFDWRNSSEAMQAYREAEVRGKENPIFAGASYIWNGIVIHTHEFVGIGNDGGSAGNVPYAFGHLLGAQSLLVAFGEMPSIVEDTRDYEEELYYAWRVTMNVKTPVFNGKRYGSITTLIARTNVSGT